MDTNELSSQTFRTPDPAANGSAGSNIHQGEGDPPGNDGQLKVVDPPNDNESDEDGPPPLEGDSAHDTPAVRKLPQGVESCLRGGGDVILVLGLPSGFTVGCDCFSLTVQGFHGLRGIPAGPHFLWLAHQDGVSARCGIWIVSSGTPKAHVLQWDKFNEVLVEATDEARYQADKIDAAKLIDYSNPGPVPRGQPGLHEPQPPAWAETTQTWEQLSSCISEKVLNRITGQPRGDWNTNTTDRVKGASLMAAEVELDQHLSNSFPEEREFKFIFEQLSRTYSTANTGSDRTLEATDATHYIQSVVDDPTGEVCSGDLVGEFQFAYIVGVHLGNDSCIQQWWHMLLKLFLRAYSLPASCPRLMESLLRATAAQLKHSTHYLDTSVLDYREDLARSLRLALTVFKRRLDELPSRAMPAALAFAQLEATVAKPPLEWDLRGDSYLRSGTAMTEDGEQIQVEMEELEDEDERGEYAPQIVECDEVGRERGLVSWGD